MIRLLPILAGCAPFADRLTPGGRADPSSNASAVDPDTAGDTASTLGSPCTVEPDHVTCPYVTTALPGGREVHHQVPLGDPPPAGWPVAVLFQGSFSSAERAFEGGALDPFGGLNQARVVDRLLAEGFAVVAPEAHLDGSLFWDTNVPPWSVSWEGSPDDQMMQELLQALQDGSFGPLDPDRLVATGISSGGYMTSRMAASYPGRFGALAIHSASWATCSGPLCLVPELPPDHPPTRFLHGALDTVVPSYTTGRYRAKLQDLGVPTDRVLDWGAGHAWLDDAPDAIAEWFLLHAP